MARNRLRIGFCGVGSMGQMAHLKNYVVEDACDVVAIAELREETGRAVAQRYGIENVYADAADMIKAEKLDGIVASQPFTRHGQVLPALLKAGVPVFSEKPLSSSVQIGKKILRAVKRSRTFLMVGYHKRSDPATMYVKATIDELKGSGELGALTYVRVTMPPGDWIANGFEGMVDAGDPRPQLPGDPPPADMDEQLTGRYIGFVNYYIHQVNLLRHLLGESYKVTYADKAGKLLVGESVSGVTCELEMQPYSTSIDWQESALVCFERGWVKLALPAPVASYRPGTVQVYKEPTRKGHTPVLSSPTLPWVHAMRQQATNFCRAILGTMPPMETAEGALEDLVVARSYIKMRYGK